MKFLFHSLIDFLKTAQFFTNTPRHILPPSLMISIASRDTFGGFTFAAFSTKNIPVTVGVVISPTLIEPSMFFFQLKLLIYCIVFFHIKSKAYYIGLV